MRKEELYSFEHKGVYSLLISKWRCGRSYFVLSKRSRFQSFWLRPVFFYVKNNLKNKRRGFQWKKLFYLQMNKKI